MFYKGYRLPVEVNIKTVFFSQKRIKKLFFQLSTEKKSLTGKTMLKVYIKNNKITSLTENYYLY